MNITKDKLSKSPKEKSIEYETIFDHNPTKKELEFIGVRSHTREEYLEKIDNNENQIYDGLFNLYELRFDKTKQKKDKETARKYFDKMTDEYALSHYSCITFHPALWND
jgi:hypothetical protein